MDDNQNHCGLDATTEAGSIRGVDSNRYRVLSSRLFMRTGDYKLIEVNQFNVILKMLECDDDYTVPMPRCTLQEAINLGLITVIKGEV